MSAGRLPSATLDRGPAAAATAGASYRTDAAGTAERVLAGAHADLAAEARHALATLDAMALAAVLITAAPLATAWLEALR